jgi:hypothetical protein
LERSRAFFTRRSDMPCSGSARFEPCSGTARLGSVVSGTSPPQLAASTATTLSPIHSGAVPPTSATAGVRPWPPPVIRGTWTSGAPPPRISNDCKRRGAAFGSATGATLGVDTEFDDLPRDRCLCRESEFGRSKPS